MILLLLFLGICLATIFGVLEGLLANSQKVCILLKILKMILMLPLSILLGKKIGYSLYFLLLKVIKGA